MIDCGVGIVGAGAAGLWAAIAAAREGADVVVVEKTPRCGTKVLASGGTHCNLTTTLSAREAARLFGPRGERFLRRAFDGLTPDDVRERFATWGVDTVTAPLEKVFPASGRARDVRDALEREARAAGARIVLDAPIDSIAREADRWIARGPSVCLRASALLLAPGGKSVPKSGTTGDGYRWLAALDLPMVEPVPGLVGLTSPAGWVRELTGLALQDAEVRLVDRRRKELGRRRRPLLFTHQGVSGPGAMDLAEAVARSNEGLELRVDVAPDRDRESLRDLFVAAAGEGGAPRVRHLIGDVPKRLFAAVAEQAGLDQLDPRANALSKPARHELIEALKGLRIPVDGTLGFEGAEVTAGGLALSEVDPGSMAVRGCDGLFVFGELLDLQGPIGGLNFQAAFATAELAGRAVAARSRAT